MDQREACGGCLQKQVATLQMEWCWPKTRAVRSWQHPWATPLCPASCSTLSWATQPQHQNTFLSQDPFTCARHLLALQSTLPTVWHVAKVLSTAVSRSYVLHTMGSGLCCSCPPAQTSCSANPSFLQGATHIFLSVHTAAKRSALGTAKLSKESFLQAKGQPGEQHHLPQPKSTDDLSPKHPAARLLY